MTTTTAGRIALLKTSTQLQKELAFVFPSASPATGPMKIQNSRVSVPNKLTKSNVVWDATARTLHVLLVKQVGASPEQALSLLPLNAPEEFDIRLANAYVRIFQEDCYSAPDEHRHAELWETLTASRVPRSIARMTPFTTAPFLKWLTVMESASHLRYEGSAFQSIAIMSKQSQWVTERINEGYINLPSPLSFRQALLNEKWIRAITTSSEIALHGVGRPGNIQGIFDLSSIPHGKPKRSHRKNEPYIPELKFVLPTKLQGITRFIVDGTMAFVCAPNGDLYVILPNGVSFVRTQGRWHYLNFVSFQSLLSEHISATITPHILRLLLDLSFERRGALICVPKESESVKQMVPDHSAANRSNYELREAMRGAKIDNWNIRHILKAVAGVDGGTIVKNDGTIADVACMIGEPTTELLNAAGHPRLERYPGARSTAAWNASMYGISIKVSEDGPISVFSKGKLVGQLG